jgi:O-antigen/teichoic acid export membrane protein
VGTALGLDLAMAMLQVGGLVGLVAGGRLSALSGHAVVGLACLVVAGAWLGRVRGDFVVRWGPVGRELRRSWAFGRWLFAGGAVAVVHSYLMHWLLLATLGAAVMGAFAACATLADLSNPLIIGVGNLAGPWAARSFVQAGPAGVRRTVWRIALPLTGAMSALCVLAALFGGTAASWLFHGDYSRHGPTITVLAVVALVNALSMAANTGLSALERPRVSFIASVAGLGVTVLAAACLVAPLQGLGAAFGLLAGNLTGAAIRYVVLLRLTSGRAGGWKA